MLSYNDRVERFDARAKAVASHLKCSTKVLVIGHIDADGIAATSIAKIALQREGIEVVTRSVKKIDDGEVGRIEKEEADTVLLVDLGSGMGTRFKDAAVCIADHHAPDVLGGRTSQVNGKVRKTGRGRDASPVSNSQRHIDQPHLILNPMDFGIDGSREISGAGASYWIAKSMNLNNRDLAALAVVGAVGDFQDSDDGRLVGLNATIVDDGVAAGSLRVEDDVRLYGRVTRPLTKFIQYSDMPLPWVMSWEGCRDFFRGLRISLGSKESLRTWSDLSSQERERVIDALEEQLAAAGKGDFKLRGEAYVLTKEAKGTELSDAKEYSTLLNSCGRHDAADLGVELCTTSRDDDGFANVLRRVKAQLKAHRETIRGGIDAFDMAQLVTLGSIQYYRTADGFAMPHEFETTLGTVLGMILSSGKIGTDRPLFAFAKTDEEGVKVSVRGTKELVAKGLNLSEVMRVAAGSVKGFGGGHNIAAGATVPIGAEEPFLRAAEEIVSRQIS